MGTLHDDLLSLITGTLIFVRCVGWCKPECIIRAAQKGCSATLCRVYARDCYSVVRTMLLQCTSIMEASMSPGLSGQTLTSEKVCINYITRSTMHQ